METVALGVLGEKLLAEAQSASSGRCAVTIHGGHVHSLRQTLIAVAAGHVLDEHENTGELTLARGSSQRPMLRSWLRATTR